MTLTVTLINRHGIWQSSDLRICDPRTKTLVDDYSIKHVGFRCPDGAALLTYAGVGRVKDVHLSDWIRQFVRGESYTVDQTLIQIRQRATEDLGELLLEKQIPHMFSIGAFLNGIPWVAQIRNFQFSHGHQPGPVERNFQTVAAKIPEGIAVPWPPILPSADMTLLMKVATRRPRKPKEFNDLLASINLRTAISVGSNGTVSQHCVTSYLPPNGDDVQTHAHNMPPGRSIPFSPFLLFGVDVTELARETMAWHAALREGKQIPDDSTDAAGQDAVTARNRLKRK